MLGSVKFTFLKTGKIANVLRGSSQSQWDYLIRQGASEREGNQSKHQTTFLFENEVECYRHYKLSFKRKFKTKKT